MGEKQLQELGYRLTRLRIIFSIKETTHFAYPEERIYININLLQLKNYYPSLRSRGFTEKYINLQALLHEIAHYKQFLKYGKGNRVIYNNWKYSSGEKGEKVADRYALMYYRKFAENAIYT